MLVLLGVLQVLFRIGLDLGCIVNVGEYSIESHGAVRHMEWIENYPQCLVILYSNGSLVLWDAQANKVVSSVVVKKK